MVCSGIICTIKLTDLTCSASAFAVSAPGTTFPDIFSEMSNKLLTKCLTKYYVAQFCSVKLPTARQIIFVYDLKQNHYVLEKANAWLMK
jgi:hypothetical protein